MLLFDSWYDHYRGVICLVAITDGSVTVGKSVNISCWYPDRYLLVSSRLAGLSF